jgi:4-oxalocrotonate tautomerase
MLDTKNANNKTRKQNYLTSKLQRPLMPIVDVKMWKGLSVDAAEQIITGITKVFVELGIPERAVEVVIHEIPKTHWGIGGKPASKAMAEEKPP